MRERREAMRARRKTRVQPSQLDRRKAAPRRTFGDRYTAQSYWNALRHAMRAAARAGRLAESDFWHPHQQRHARARLVARAHGAEAARAVLGHAKVDTTTLYIGRDEQLAVETVMATEAGTR